MRQTDRGKIMRKRDNEKRHRQTYRLTGRQIEKKNIN